MTGVTPTGENPDKQEEKHNWMKAVCRSCRVVPIYGRTDIVLTSQVEQKGVYCDKCGRKCAIVYVTEEPLIDGDGKEVEIVKKNCVVKSKIYGSPEAKPRQYRHYCNVHGYEWIDERDVPIVCPKKTKVSEKIMDGDDEKE